MAKTRKLFLDTNVLIDYCDPKRERHAEVVDLLRSCWEEDNYVVYALASSLNDVYYILHRRYHNEPWARAMILRLMDVFSFVDLRTEYARQAAASDEPDFEDGVIRAAAENLGVEALITSDRAAFAGARVAHLSPAEYSPGRSPMPSSS